ncbi:hypothetical protein L1987_14243 [Smallanthus sonchifolius]|uniref:Uncharacterized protein n=1 Tax=Smallanthus sonchifolius TaxID=185202 RepID=A0ACB9J3U4_9ASTR|nr:hypothetical protein L1987_14243 [Smallanthus sonchifolius]
MNPAPGESAKTVGRELIQDALVGKNPELSIKFHEESKSVAGWKQLSLVGEVLDMGILSDLKNRLNGLVESGTDLRYIGGMKVMLTFCSTVGARKFLNDRRMDHELIFKELAIWEGQDVPFDRISWVQVHGVPIQLWEGNTFDRIGQLLSKVVEFSSTSNKTGNLSFDEIDILVSNPLRISTSMNLEWGGKSYLVRLEESIRCWDPGFLTMPESSTNFFSGSFFGRGGRGSPATVCTRASESAGQPSNSGGSPQVM